MTAVPHNPEVCGLLELTLPGLGPDWTMRQDAGKYRKPSRLLDVDFEQLSSTFMIIFKVMFFIQNILYLTILRFSMLKTFSFYFS